MPNINKQYTFAKGMGSLLRGNVTPQNVVEQAKLCSVREYLDRQAFSLGSSSWSIGEVNVGTGVSLADYPLLKSPIATDEVTVSFYVNVLHPKPVEPFVPNLHMWTHRPTMLYTREIKTYNIAVLFASALQGKVKNLNSDWQLEYMQRLVTFLGEKLKQYNAEVFEICLLPERDVGLWMDDITQDTLSCEQVQIKFYSLSPSGTETGRTSMSKPNIKEAVSGGHELTPPLSFEEKFANPLSAALMEVAVSAERAAKLLKEYTEAYKANQHTRIDSNPEGNDDA